MAEEWLPLWEWAAPDPDDPLPPDKPQERSLPFLERLGLELAYHRQQLELGRLETSSPHPAPPSQGRLLVVDDDPFLRSYLARRLRLAGYEVDEAANVETATRLLRERAYDLITLDLIMDPQSGYDLFHYLKADPTLKWIPLIVLSGRGSLATKSAASSSERMIISRSLFNLRKWPQGSPGCSRGRRASSTWRFAIR
ncbi:response regulator [Paenibacillus sp. CC-CFT747]|nr:response regulator [Paenibacillus sp. CC-CFT747]